MATASDTSLSVAHQTRFALRLAAALFSPSQAAGSATNAALSPLSLHVLLSLLAAGAGGGTRDQLAAALGGSDGPAGAEGLHALAEQVLQRVLADGFAAGGPHVAFANGVFVDASLKLKPAFEEVAVGNLLSAGAGGATRDQLSAVLGGGDGPGGAEGLHALAEQMMHFTLADGSAAGGPRIAFGNSVFVDSLLKLKPAFQEIATGKYKAETRSVDFRRKAAEAAAEVNSWVENVTSSLIKDILPRDAVDKDTMLVLVNALYFKGIWTKKFDASETKDH
ncbi:hypothetical protein EJB05_05681, partial [Eragrostis curvula]